MAVNQWDQDGDLRSYMVGYWKVEQLFIYFSWTKDLGIYVIGCRGNWSMEKHRAKSSVQICNFEMHLTSYPNVFSS